METSQEGVSRLCDWLGGKARKGCRQSPEARANMLPLEKAGMWSAGLECGEHEGGAWGLGTMIAHLDSITRQ